MSTSPIPPDPYVALGVSKDADLGTIRSAHRKLAFKYHPDRIKDETLREQGKNEFQKAQQAYELLSDPEKRSKYDDQIKLAELRREQMMREPTRPPPTAYAARNTPGPATTVKREMRDDGHYYEDRVPQGSFFDSRDRYEEPTPRPSARKPDSFERKVSSSKPSERKDKTPSKWDEPVKGMSMKMAFRMKEKAQQAREKTRDKEAHARSAKVRDRDERRERSDKHSGRRTAYVDDESESDSDTVVSAHRTPPLKSSKASAPRSRKDPEPEPIKMRPSVPQNRRSHDEDSYESEQEKWERHHQETRNYIAQSQKRPPMPRSGSGAYVYWEKEMLRDRRSGSDSEKRPSSSSKNIRRTPADEDRPRPSMPTHNSEPRSHRPQMVDREPSRAKTNYPAERENRREPPSLSRAQTMPMPRSGKKDNAPTKGSNLKHGEFPQDSGYGSSSTSPHTPEFRGESPPSRDPRRRETTTARYRVDPNDDEPRSRVTKILDEDDSRRRRTQSPEDDRRDSFSDDRRDRERPSRPRVDTDTRPRPSRSGYSTMDTRPGYPRTDSIRYEHASPTGRGKLYAEISPDRETFHRYDPASVKTTNHRNAASANYANYRVREDYDSVPGSRFLEQVRSPNIGSKRSPVF